MRCWLNFIFVLFFLAILAPSCMGQDRIELGYQTTKRGIVWYRNGLPKHNPAWRLSRDTNAVIWCDTFTTLRYWWSYKEDKWITDGVLTSTLPPLPTQTSGSTTIDNRQATWVPANNIRHRFDVNQTAWVPIGDWFYLANAPSNVASGGSNGAAVYTTSLWQDSDDFIVRYWDGDSWEPFGGSGSKWTDAGDYTYLTQTTDRVLVGSSSEVNINYNFQVAGDGYFEDGIRIDGPLNAGGFNGTSVQYLRSAGSGSPPQWITPENLTSATTGEIGVTNGSGATFTAVDLRIAQQGATVGQVLKWNGTKWTPDDDLSGGSTGGGIYGDGTANSGDDNLPPGGSTVTTNNYPLQFQTAAAASLVSNILQFLVPYSADDAFTNYLSGYTPIDSVKLFNFDGGTYLKAYSGDLNLESDQIVLLTADSVQVSTVQTTTKIPAVVGINGQGTLKQIVGSANGDVLTWDGTGWEAAAGGGGGGGVTGTGTANYVTYWTGASTIAADVDFQFDGTRVGIQGAPVSGFSLYTANAVRFDGTAVIRGSGDNFTGSTSTPHFRLWNTTAGTGDTWYVGSENDGELSITSSNLGGIQAKFTANGDYQLTNALEMKVDAAPPSAPTDGLSLYTEEKGLQFPAWIDEAGQTWEVSPGMVGSKWGTFNPVGNGTTISVVGITSNASGSAATRTVSSTNLFTSTRRIGYTTGTTTNTAAGNRHNLQQFFRGNAANVGGFYFACRFGFSTADAANKSAFIGLIGQTTQITGGTNPSSLTNLIGVGIDAGQTTLRFIRNDASGTATTTDLGANFPSNQIDNTLYDLRIYAKPNAGNVYYWLKNLSSGNVTSGTVSTDLPTGTQLLCPQIHVSNGASATSVGIDIVQYYIITNY